MKKYLLMATLFLLPWQTHLLLFPGTNLGGVDASPFTSIKLYAVELLVLLTVAVTVVVKKERSIMVRTYRLPLMLALAVSVVAAASVLWSVSYPLSLGMLLHVLCAMFLFALLLDHNLPLRPLLYAFGLGLVVPSLLGLWQVWADASPASTLLGLAERNAQTLGDAVTVQGGVRQLRAYGSFSHPNVFAGYLAVGAIALQSLTRHASSSLRRVGGLFTGAPRHMGMVAAVMLLTLTLVLTGSRSAFLGLLLGTVLAGLVAAMKNTARARMLVIPIAIGVIAGAWAITIAEPQIVAGIRGGGVTEDASVTERIAQYATYPQVVQGAWVMGTGLGTYAIAAYVHGTCADWSCQPVHNIPLLIVGELGIVGLAVVLAWSSSIDRINFARFPNRDALVAFAMGNVVLVVLFFDHYIWSSWSGLALIAFVMALTVRMGEQRE